MTTEEADVLAEIGKKIGEPILWRLHVEDRQEYRFTVTVVPDSGNARLSLWGRAAPDDWAYGLRVDAARGINIRKISTPHPGHWDPEEQRDADPEHKHRHTTVFAAKSLYYPDDIRWDNHNVALIDFIAECNIMSLHEVPELLFQGHF